MRWNLYPSKFHIYLDLCQDFQFHLTCHYYTVLNTVGSNPYSCSLSSFWISYKSLTSTNYYFPALLQVLLILEILRQYIPIDEIEKKKKNIKRKELSLGPFLLLYKISEDLIKFSFNSNLRNLKEHQIWLRLLSTQSRKYLIGKSLYQIYNKCDEILTTKNWMLDP